MEVREWLSAVALRNGSTPSNARHYHGFAAPIRKDFPSLACTEATAFAVGGLLGGLFPAWDDLRSAIKGVMSEAGDDHETTPEQRMTAKWVSFYRRRVREAPDKRDHLLSLLRKVDMDAFKAVDDGSTDRAAAAFDEAFWEARGGHPGYLPHNGVGIPQLRHIALPANHRSAVLPPEPPQQPRASHLTGDHLAAAYERIGNPAARMRVEALDRDMEG